MADEAATRSLKRLLLSPYSFTSSFSDLPAEGLPSFSRFFDKNQRVRGSRTIMPVSIHSNPTGRKEKNSNGS